MKKLLIGILFVFLMGCTATHEAIVPADTSHNVKVTVIGKDVTDCDDNKWKLSTITKLGESMAIVQLYASLSSSDHVRMQRDLLWLEVFTDIRNILVTINSPGGDAFTGLSISDLIRRYRAKGWTVNTHGSGIIASAAVPIFASGEERIADQASIFMVHEAALWKWPGRETASDIAAQGSLMVLMREKYIDILMASSNLSEDEWLLMEAKTSWFSADRALEIGIVTRIE